MVNSVGLSRLSEQSQASAQDAHVQALNTRVAELEQQSAASKRQPKPVAQPDFEAARKALDERLSQVEQARRGQPCRRPAGAAGPRGRHRGPPEESRYACRDAPAHRRGGQAQDTGAAVQRGRPELRGGERFLSIAAPGVTAVRELRLLREGDAIGAWQLQAIEAHAAVFHVDGQTQRIALP